MTVEASAPAGRRLARLAFIVGVPILVWLIGLVIRYFAQRYAGGGVGLVGYAKFMCRWDCGWYADVALFGYPSAPKPIPDGGASWAFFPLSPLLTRAVYEVTRLPMPLAGMLAGSLAIVGAAIAAWPLVESRRAYVLLCVLLLAGPASFYFTLGYSESLFVLLSMLAFAALRRSDYAGAGLASAFLSATRVVGVMMALAILGQAFADHRKRGGTLSGFPRYVLADGRLLLGLALSPLGLVAYMLYLYFRVGDPLAFVRIQDAWHRAFDWPWVWLSEGLVGGSALDLQLSATACVGLLLAAYLFFRRRYPEAIFSALSLLLPLGTGLASLPRFVAGLAPFYLLAANGLSRSRVVFALAIALALALGFWATQGWVTRVQYFV